MSSETERIRKYYNTCEPNTPAPKKYYIDFSQSRGSGDLRAQVIGRIEKANEYVHLLFTGHVGCGKSSELNALQSELEAVPKNAGRKHFFVCPFSTLEYTNAYDLSIPELILAFVAEFGAVLRDRAGIQLEDSYFVGKYREIWEYLTREVDVSEADISLGTVKTKLTLLPAAEDSRKKIREKLKPQTSSLISEINNLFSKARALLQGKGYDDFLLVIDDLEKIQKIEGFDEGGASHRELFIDRAPFFTEMKAHTLITIPLTLARTYATELSVIYKADPVVLPMVKLFERDHQTRFEKGWSDMRRMAQARFTPEDLDKVIEQDAMEYLIQYSGGHTRQLMMFLQNALLTATTLPLSLPQAKLAIRSTIESYSTSVRPDWWDRLVAIHKHQSMDVDFAKSDFQEMLRRIVVLEYVNGGDESDEFAVAGPWYAVHPIVRQLPPFKAALQRAANSAS